MGEPWNPFLEPIRSPNSRNQGYLPISGSLAAPTLPTGLLGWLGSPGCGVWWPTPRPGGPHQHRPHPASVTNARQTSELAFHFPRFSRTDAVPSALLDPPLHGRLTRRLVGGERRRDCVEVVRGRRKGVGTRWRTCAINKNTLCNIVLIKVKLYHIPRVFALQTATSPVAPVLVSQGFQCIDFRKWRLSIGEMICKCTKTGCKAVIGLATFPTRTVIYIVLFRSAGTSE